MYLEYIDSYYYIINCNNNNDLHLTNDCCCINNTFNIDLYGIMNEISDVYFMKLYQYSNVLRTYQ